MSNLSPRIRAYKEALKRDRLAREEASGARGNTDNSAWLATKKDDLPIQVQGVTDDKPAALPADNSDPFALPDPGFGPVADSQAAAGNSLHDVLEHAAEDDDLLEEALVQSLETTRNETGVQAQRTRAAASSLLASIKDTAIRRVYEAFIVRSSEVGTEYAPDEDAANFVTILEEVVRMTGANIYVAPDASNTEAVGQALFQRRLLTVDNLLAAWTNLVKRGEVPVMYEGQRPISDSERRAAQVQAASGDVQGAIISLLQVALPSIGNVTTPQEIYAVVGDPGNHDVLLDVVVSCWGATAAALAAGFRDTAENRQAIDIVIGDRPVTVDNVRQAWEQVKRSRAPRSLPEQSAAAANRPPSVDELDELSDDDVSNLLNAVTRDRARSTRRLL